MISHYLLTEFDHVTNNFDDSNIAAGTSQNDDLHIILRSYPDSGEKTERPFVHRYMSNSVFYRICTAFEVKVRMQSLRLLELESGNTASGGSVGDSASLKTWTTKEANSCVLNALLLCLIPV